jgi:single-strand DNA-binding protein
MIFATVNGRLGREPELRTTQSGAVLSFSVAADHGFGEKKTTTWVKVSVWGKRGESLAKILDKGTQVSVCGELYTREHDGKTYVECRASEVELMGGKGRSSAEPTQAANAGDESIPF